MRNLRSNKKAQVIVMFLLAIAILTFTGEVVYGRPLTPTEMRVHCGTVTCTLYLDKSETERLASTGTLVTGGITALCTAFGTPLIGTACLASTGQFVGGAQSAKSQNKCYKVTPYVIPPPLPFIWFSHGSYTCGGSPWVSARPVPQPGGGGGGTGAR